MKRVKVVISGVGSITPLGVGNKALWDGILKKQTGIEHVEVFFKRQKIEDYFLHKVSNINLANLNVSREDIEAIRNWKGGEHNADLLLLLGAIQLALNDAGIDSENKKNSLSLVVAHENPGIEQFLWKIFRDSFELLTNNKATNAKEYFNQLYSKVVKLGYETQSFMSLFHLAKVFNIHKYSLIINNACASGQFSLEAAKDIIVSKKSRTVIVVAGDCPGVFKLKWFKDLGMCPHDGKTLPFDTNRNGFLLGEGAVALILEDYNHAKKRGARIYAEYLGGEYQLESWGITTPKIGWDYYHRTILSSLKNTGVNKNEVDLICAHGVAIPTSDYYEAKAVADIFKRAPPVVALKPYVGHNLGGSNLIEIAILLLAMQHDYIPPTLNTTCVDKKFSINLALVGQKKKLNTVLKLCSAFAGYNAATVLRKI